MPGTLKWSKMFSIILLNSRYPQGGMLKQGVTEILPSEKHTQYFISWALRVRLKDLMRIHHSKKPLTSLDHYNTGHGNCGMWLNCTYPYKFGGEHSKHVELIFICANYHRFLRGAEAYTCDVLPAWLFWLSAEQVLRKLHKKGIPWVVPGFHVLVVGMQNFVVMLF